MLISKEQRSAKLRKLAEIEGFGNAEQMIEAAAVDSVFPGICITDGCSYTSEIEPEQTQGWCEECRQGTVQSALILAGLI